MLNARELEAERRLVEASKREPRRFAELYDRYFDRVYAFALTRTRDRTLAEDVTADTFRRALENLAHFKWRGIPFSAWLFRIAANVASEQMKQNSRETALPESLPATDGEPSWEEAVIQVETRARLFELVRRLPADQRRVVLMRFGQEKSLRLTAEALGRSEGAVKLLQHRAIQNLRKGWVGEWDD